jgi:MazG family protein
MTKKITAIDRLLDVMRRLRDPATGCPWDVEQDFGTIAPYTIEEAYEVADAIASGDMAALREELGDLLLQVVFHAQMAAEDGLFTFDDVANAISDKMIARHPHVFADVSVADAEAQTQAWEARKQEERRAKAVAESRRPSVLDNVPLALPGLTRAEKLQERAARVGFDWPDSAPALAKVTEETAELAAEIAAGTGVDRLEDEIGDLYFAVTNVARHLGIDPEAAVRRANRKFEERFRYVEQSVENTGKMLTDASLDELEQQWRQAKLREQIT